MKFKRIFYSIFMCFILLITQVTPSFAIELNKNQNNTKELVFIDDQLQDVEYLLNNIPESMYAFLIKSDEFRRIGERLTIDGDILLYGCRTWQNSLADDFFNTHKTKRTK